MSDSTYLPHILVLGAGFGGLKFCQKFPPGRARITVVDWQNHHLFQPLLYQVATAGLSAPEIAQPSMATIGRSAAVAEIRRLKLSGWPAWLTWLGVHLIFLIGFRNKLSGLMQWIYSYFTYRRGARLITCSDAAAKSTD